jgi:hypothetical protein
MGRTGDLEGEAQPGILRLTPAVAQAGSRPAASGVLAVYLDLSPTRPPAMRVSPATWRRRLLEARSALRARLRNPEASRTASGGVRGQPGQPRRDQAPGRAPSVIMAVMGQAAA